MSADSPMEVDGPSAIQEPATQGLQAIFQSISSITLTPLSNSIPKNASSNREEWTAKEEQEKHRRSGEATTVEAIDFKIEVQLRKLQKLVVDRNLEVERMNKRRDQYDKTVEDQKKRKMEGRKIRQRKWEEAQAKEKFLDSLEAGKSKKD